ncbi:MAG: protein-tyrosine phosphatase family protein [Anaerolineae bacterium]
MRPLRVLVKAVSIAVYRVRHYGWCITWTWLWTRLFMWTMGHEVERYCRITPQLWLGGQMRARGWRWLMARGVTAIVNLRAKHDDRVHQVPADAYLWLPTEDDRAPAPEHFHAGVQFIHRVVAQGGAVYVHCASGVGRAPTLAAAYLVSTGMSLEQALETIRRVRPFIKLTPEQLSALRRFAENSHAHPIDGTER